jgi:predicted esterase
MKNLLVFFHGLGYSNTRDLDFATALADALDCELLMPNAPHPSGRPRGGFTWIEIGPSPELEPIFDEYKIKVSVDSVLGVIDEKLAQMGSDYSNVIFAGHSLGGPMALYMGLCVRKCKCIIPFSGCDSEDGFILSRMKYKSPIIWVAGKGDKIISPARLDTWRPIAAAGAPLNYVEIECRINGHDYPLISEIPKIAKIYKDKI